MSDNCTVNFWNEPNQIEDYNEFEASEQYVGGRSPCHHHAPRCHEKCCNINIFCGKGCKIYVKECLDGCKINIKCESDDDCCCCCDDKE